ncbi:MAG UNVERIFIED_CONTAM: hypothetical protein LVR18_07445 [Planctomycetaceae bacterium]
MRYIGAAMPSGPIQPAVSSEETISFQDFFQGRSVGCLLIENSSFSSVNISSGDYLLIDSELPLENGAHVAALDDRHSLIICVVREGAGQLVPLIPGSYNPTTRQVLGVITAVIRSFRSSQ